MKRLDDFLNVGERLPVSEAVGPKERFARDLTRVVRADDIGDRHRSLITLPEVDGVLTSSVAVGVFVGVIGSVIGATVPRRGGDLRRVYLAVDDDGRAAFATADLRETGLDLFVGNRVFG